VPKRISKASAEKGNNPMIKNAEITGARLKNQMKQVFFVVIIFSSPNPDKPVEAKWKSRFIGKPNRILD